MRPHSRTALAAAIIGLLFAAVLGGAVLWIHARVTPSRLEERLNPALLRSSDSVYRIKVGATELSLIRRTFELRDFRLEIDSARFLALRKAGRPNPTTYAFLVQSLRFDGIDVAGFMRGRYRFARITVDGFTVDAFLDRTGPLAKDDGPAPLPYDWLTAIRRPFSIDQLQLSHGSIRYGEIAADGARPGGIEFDSLDVTVSAIDNHAEVGHGRATKIELRSRFAKQAILTATAEYDLSQRALDFGYRGELTGFDVGRLNTILLNLEGMRLRSGRMDGARFDIDVKSDTATGHLTMRYHDLETELRDKKTRKRDLGMKIVTFIANHFKLRTENPEPGHAPISKPVRLIRTEDMAFFEFLWKTLRQGMLATLGV